MKRIALASAIVGAWLAGGVAAQRPIAPVVGKMIRIDGRETPEKIPDYAVWRESFLSLRNRIREPAGKLDPWSRELLAALTPGELAALTREIDQQAARDETCLKRQQEALASGSAQGLSSDVIGRNIAAEVFACRERDLEASDRVLEALGEKGREAMTTFIEHQRRIATLFVPSSELDSYMRPRE